MKVGVAHLDLPPAAFNLYSQPSDVEYPVEVRVKWIGARLPWRKEEVFYADLAEMNPGLTYQLAKRAGEPFDASGAVDRFGRKLETRCAGFTLTMIEDYFKPFRRGGDSILFPVSHVYNGKHYFAVEIDLDSYVVHLHRFNPSLGGVERCEMDFRLDGKKWEPSPYFTSALLSTHCMFDKRLGNAVADWPLVAARVMCSVWRRMRIPPKLVTERGWVVMQVESLDGKKLVSRIYPDGKAETIGVAADRHIGKKICWTLGKEKE